MFSAVLKADKSPISFIASITMEANIVMKIHCFRNVFERVAFIFMSLLTQSIRFKPNRKMKPAATNEEAAEDERVQLDFLSASH